MHRLKRLAARGSRGRATEIDESSTKWKDRAGRSAGPATYVPGDLCASVFSQSTLATHSERDGIYGGPVILVGLLEATGLPTVGGSKALP